MLSKHVGGLVKDNIVSEGIRVDEFTGKRFFFVGSDDLVEVERK
jgi:hypothetical protein